MSNTVKLTLDSKSPPILTEEQKVRLAALAPLPDDQIDTSDAPFRPDAVWVKAVDFPHAKSKPKVWAGDHLARVNHRP